MLMWHLGTWFRGGLGSTRLVVGLDHLQGLFQSKCNIIPNSRYLNIQAFEGQFHTALILGENRLFPYHNYYFYHSCYFLFLVLLLVSCYLPVIYISMYTYY